MGRACRASTDAGARAKGSLVLSTRGFDPITLDARPLVLSQPLGIEHVSFLAAVVQLEPGKDPFAPAQHRASLKDPGAGTFLLDKTCLGDCPLSPVLLPVEEGWRSRGRRRKEEGELARASPPRRPAGVKSPEERRRSRTSREEGRPRAGGDRSRGARRAAATPRRHRRSLPRRGHHCIGYTSAPQ
jgi:hypothetical protein